MKKISVLLFGVILLFCCSCSSLDNRKYICDIEAVKSVQIVRLEKLEPYYKIDYTVLFEITDCATFVNRLNALGNSAHWGSPYVMRAQDIVIRIEFQNGDYDFLKRNTQFFYRSGTFKDGRYIFDKEAFEILISDYMPK